MAGLCEGGNEPSGSLKAISNSGTREHLLRANADIYRLATCMCGLMKVPVELKKQGISTDSQSTYGQAFMMIGY
ncbi:hypothetical protein ANN_24535 [Periplaneta americana]|uniref:Uncharacterized protein n=1 Tax=Periplaneta americana TaxID=6978 RepID=A0ABQ8S3I0_PERAM|nr:hypothetical protein ANN_24535 [Periplaneta americana]